MLFVPSKTKGDDEGATVEDEESAIESEEEAALDRISFSSVAVAMVDGLSGVTVKFSAQVQTSHVTMQHASLLQEDDPRHDRMQDVQGLPQARESV